MRRTFDKGVLVGIGLVVALLVLNAGLAYRNTRQLLDDAGWVAHTHEVLDLTGDVLRTLVDAETGQRGFLLTGQENFLEPYRQALTRLDPQLRTLKDKTHDNPRQQAHIEDLEQLAAERLALLHQGIARRRRGAEEAQAWVATGTGKEKMDALRRLIATMEEDEQDLLKDREWQSGLAYRTAVTTELVAAAVGLGLIGSLVFLVRRNLHERTQAATLVHKQRERLHTTLTSIGDAVIVTDAQGRVTFLNPLAESLTGWSQGQAQGQPLEAVFPILHEQTRQPVENPVARVLREGIVVGVGNHTVLLARDGTERPIDDSAAPIRDETGETVGVVLTFRDVTEQRQAQVALRQSEARKTAILETALDGIITMNPEGKVIEFNPAAERTFGYRRAQAVGRELCDLVIPPSLREEHRRGLAHYLVTGEGPVLDKRLEMTALRADGTEFPVELAVTRIPTEGPPLFTAYLRDISERKCAEGRRSARLAVTQTLAEAATVQDAAARILQAVCAALGWDVGAFWTLDQPSNVLRCLEVWHGPQVRTGEFAALTRRHTFGPGVGLPGRVWGSGQTAWIPDVTQDANFPRAAVAAQEGLHGAFACPIVRGTETLGVIEFFSRQIREPDADLLEMMGTVAGQIGQFLERRRAEDQLRRSERELADFFENATEGLHWVGPDGTILRANRAELNLLGYLPEEYVGHNLAEFHADKGVIGDILRRLQAGEELHNYEARLRCKDGSLRYVLIDSNVMREEGRFAHTRSFIRDVTERKVAEQALRESEGRFRGLMEQAPFSIQVFAPDGRTVRVNRAWEELWGVTFNQIADYNILEDQQLAAKGVRQYVRRAFDGEPVHIPAIQYDPNETIPDRSRHTDPQRWVAAVAYPLKDAAGQVREVVLVHQDITAQRRAEEALLAVHRELEAKVAQRTAELSQANQFLQALLENVQDGIVACNAEGVLTLFNRATREFHGLREQPIPADQWAGHYDLYRADGQTRMSPEEVPLFRALQGERVENVEMVITPRAGPARTLLASGQAFYDDQGVKLGAVVSMHDITGRKRAEEALRQAHEELERRVEERTAELAQVNDALRESERRCLAEALPNLVWTDRPDGQCDYLSSQWGAYTGIPEQELLGLTWLERVIHPDDRERTLACWMTAVEDKGVYDLEYRIRRHDGQYRWFKTRGVPIRDRQGRIVKWFGTCTDIEDEKRAVEALREADRRKDEFLATLAHELRNPLAPIRNSLQILKMPRLDAATAERSREMMERQVHHLVRLVDDLLDVSRVMRGKIELRTEQVELASVVARAVETAEPLIVAQGHELTLTLPPESLSLEADPVRLAQVVGNLLTNAAKYTEARGRIGLTAQREDGEAVLRVRDTGIGIAPDMLPKVFDLFVQVDHAATRSQGGLGIGLTLVKNLVEMHGGTVEAQSPGLGQGSEFVVRLPLSAQGREQPEGQEFAEDRQVTPPPGHRLLVVDDNKDAADSLALLLRLQGHEVRVAHGGPAALELAKDYRPEMVFLDIGMPEMDGYEVARRLRQQPGLESVRLAALTGWGQQEDRRRTTEAGFDHHLVKPVEPRAVEGLLADLEPTKG